MASTYTDEQLQKLLEMQDFNSEEMKLQQQMAAANQLRQQGLRPTTGKRHWTRQLGETALPAIAGAVTDYKNREAMDKLSLDKRNWLKDQAAAKGVTPPVPLGVNPNYSKPELFPATRSEIPGQPEIPDWMRMASGNSYSG